MYSLTIHIVTDLLSHPEYYQLQLSRHNGSNNDYYTCYAVRGPYRLLGMKDHCTYIAYIV